MAGGVVQAGGEEREKGRGEDGHGVLLYYKYLDLGRLEGQKEELAVWMEAMCSGLGQVGGSMDGLREHMAAVRRHPVICGADIDFKLAASEGAANLKAAEETGFKELRVSCCKELVTLGPRAAGIGVDSTAHHASPKEFHEMLSAGKDAVIIDTRNCYETRIGRFEATGVTLLDPLTRQFSDFPAWVDANEAQIRGRQIFMYCTGGVRCERASAYVRSKGDGFQDVVQLSGGIQRYLEAFPDGGFFRGKNFVFDERLAVGNPTMSQAVGRCMLCQDPTEDYGCCYSYADPAQSGGARGGSPSLSASSAPQRMEEPVLFAAIPKGRTAALRKKLAGFVELVFVDAPHELPLWYKQPQTGATGVDCEAAANGTGGVASRANEGPIQSSVDLPCGCKPKRAWLVTPETLETVRRCRAEGVSCWEQAPTSCNQRQHLYETDGWDETWRHLKAAIESQGPFDGIMGFSQGAAVAAFICQLQHLVGQSRNAPTTVVDGTRSWAEMQELFSHPQFRFAWLCSGYPLRLPESPQLGKGETIGPVAMPSMHVYGGAGEGDWQVTGKESADVAAMFAEESREEVVHPGGHFIPCSKPFIKRYKGFLAKMMHQHPAS